MNSPPQSITTLVRDDSLGKQFWDCLDYHDRSLEPLLRHEAVLLLSNRPLQSESPSSVPASLAESLFAQKSNPLLPIIVEEGALPFVNAELYSSTLKLELCHGDKVKFVALGDSSAPKTCFVSLLYPVTLVEFPGAPEGIYVAVMMETLEEVYSQLQKRRPSRLNFDSGSPVAVNQSLLAQAPVPVPIPHHLSVPESDRYLESPRRFTSLTVETFKSRPVTPLLLDSQLSVSYKKPEVHLDLDLLMAGDSDSTHDEHMEEIASNSHSDDGGDGGDADGNHDEKMVLETVLPDGLSSLNTWEDLVDCSKEVISKLQNLSRNPNLQPDECAEEYQTFLYALQEHLETLPKLPSEMNLEDTLEWVEEFICKKLYSNIFSPEIGDDRPTDRLLESRIAALSMLNMELSNLGIETNKVEPTYIEKLVRNCTKELLKMDQQKTPKLKLEAIAVCHRLISESLERRQASVESLRSLSSTSTTAAAAAAAAAEKSKRSSLFGTLSKLNSDADSVLSILIYIVVRANPPRLISNLRFIKRYRNESLIREFYSYCFTNMLAVISFLETADLHSIGLSAKAAAASKSQSDLSKSLSLPTDFAVHYTSSVSTPQIPQPLSATPNTAPIIKEPSSPSFGKFGGSGGVVGLFGRWLGRKSATSPVPTNTVVTSTSHNDTLLKPVATNPRRDSLNTGTGEVLMKVGGNFNIKPPIKRFMDCVSVQQLQASDQQVLLEDYQRIARILMQLEEKRTN